MDSSKFNLWRACFLFCRVDGVLNEKEKNWIDEKIKNLPFTEEQRQTLVQDNKAAPQIEDLLGHITKPADRGFLVDQMRYLSKIDGNLAPIEKSKIDEIRNKVLAKVDVKGLEKQIEADEKASYHEDEVYKVHNDDSMFERLHRYIQKTANPGDYKFPKK